MDIAIVGRGSVGEALAGALARAGHRVVVGARSPDPSADPPQAPVAEAVEGAEVVVLAVPWEAVGAVAAETGPLEGRIVVDCTNPIGPGFRHAPGPSHASGGEAVQAAFPGASVVKAFATVGSPAMADAAYPGGRPFMPVCGDDPEARRTVLGLVEDVGFEGIDVGSMSKAVHLEHLALLWITMARESGLGREFAMGVLRR